MQSDHTRAKARCAAGVSLGSLLGVQKKSPLPSWTGLQKNAPSGRFVRSFLLTGVLLLSLPFFGGPKASATTPTAPAVTDTAPAAASALPRLERIRLANTVRVCIWPDYYSISWRDPRTHALSGLDIDLARELAKDLGVEAVFVDSSFAKLIDDVQGDRCDIAMFGIGITPQREQQLAFSRPHLASDIYAITTRSNRTVLAWSDIDRPGRVVAVAKGTLHETIMRERLREAELMVVDSPKAREHAVESGRADVFMTDYPYTRRMLANAQWARLIEPDTRYHMTPYAWAVALGDSAWVAYLNTFVATIQKDGRLLSAARAHQLEPIVVLD